MPIFENFSSGGRLRVLNLSPGRPLGTRRIKYIKKKPAHLAHNACDAFYNPTILPKQGHCKHHSSTRPAELLSGSFQSEASRHRVQLDYTHPWTRRKRRNRHTAPRGTRKGFPRFTTPTDPSPNMRSSCHPCNIPSDPTS